MSSLSDFPFDNSSPPSEHQKLTQDYLYLIDELHKALSITTIPDEDFLVHEWKDKFINDFFARIDAGRTRNLYLAKFIECLRNKQLTGPFRKLPPYGDLPEYKSGATSITSVPTWLTKMEREIKWDTSGKPFQSYFARKSLDYGRGTCVCISLAFPNHDDDDENNDLTRETETRYQKMGTPGVL